MIYEIAGLRIDIQNKYEYTDGFCAEYLSADQASPVHLFACVSNEEFLQEKTQSPDFSDGYIENICLYRKICLQLPVFSRMLLHCAVLEYKGKGYAFLGKSGTGKSTHTRLWKKYLSTPRMINGDKPILEYTNEGFIAHGTPWKGKEGWGSRISAPLCGLCFLEQAKDCSIQKLTTSQASKRIFSQVLLPSEEQNAVATLELLDKLVSATPAYLLKCDISEQAVKLAVEALTGEKYED